MERNRSIQLKAALLLVVFALNTLVGFAYSLGHSHHYDQGANHDHNSKTGKNNCCNDQVVKFAQIDKSTPQSLNAGISPIFFTVFISSFYNIDLLLTSQTQISSKYFLRSYHPPISDIRIAIQSFQI